MSGHVIDKNFAMLESTPSPVDTSPKGEDPLLSIGERLHIIWYYNVNENDYQ